jgi:hypothetical protein
MWNPFESPSNNEDNNEDNAPRENAVETHDKNISDDKDKPQTDDERRDAAYDRVFKNWQG